jgi:hypothetical protein
MSTRNGHRRARPARTNRRNITLAALLALASVTVTFLAVARHDDTAPTASAGARQGDGKGAAAKPSQTPKWDGKTKILGDGSTSYTGPKKGELKPEPLKPVKSHLSSSSSPGTARWRAATISSRTTGRWPRSTTPI